MQNVINLLLLGLGAQTTLSSPRSQQTQNILITFVQRWSSVEDIGPTLYKCYTNRLCLLRLCHIFSVESILSRLINKSEAITKQNKHFFIKQKQVGRHPAPSGQTIKPPVLARLISFYFISPRTPYLSTI